MCSASSSTLPTLNVSPSLQRHGALADAELVLPVRVALIRQVQPGSGTLRQFAGPGSVVGVDVRLGHVRNSQALLLRRPHITLNISVRVDDQRLTRRLAANQVAGLGELVVV